MGSLAVYRVMKAGLVAISLVQMVQIPDSIVERVACILQVPLVSTVWKITIFVRKIGMPCVMIGGWLPTRMPRHSFDMPSRMESAVEFVRFVPSFLNCPTMKFGGPFKIAQVLWISKIRLVNIVAFKTRQHPIPQHVVTI